MYLSRSLNEIQPKFKCDFQGCMKGRKSPNGKGIYGAQYRTRECFWLGKPCKNHQIQDFRPYCTDSDVKICGSSDWIRSYQYFKPNRHKSRRKFRRIKFRGRPDSHSVLLCDFTRHWTNWLDWKKTGQQYFIHSIFKIRKNVLMNTPRPNVKGPCSNIF